MGKARWHPVSNGAGKRHWCVRKGAEFAENSAGRYRTFGSHDAALKAAYDLNVRDGIAVSAFDDLPVANADAIRKELLAGKRMGDIRAGYPMISASRMRMIRDEVFAPLIADPEAVKALANGPLLNANEIVKYSHSRKVLERAVVPQIEMFPA